MRFAAFASVLLSCAHSTPPSAPPPPPPPQITPAPSPAPVAPAAPVVSGYDKPPQNVLDVLHAPLPPQPSVSPTRDRILLVAYDQYPSITQVAEPFLRLAGVRVEPRTRRKHDTPGGYGVAQCARSLTLVEVASSKETAVKLPPGCADAIQWSADGKLAAFANTSNDAVELWILDAASGNTHRLGTARLNPMLGDAMQWSADQHSLLVKLVPDHEGAPPSASVVADGPGIQETSGQKGESSTYEMRDTLTNKHDEELFDFYARSQLATIDIATGAVTPLGKPAIISDVSGAPDGEHVLVTSIKKPYSYVTTYPNFAHDVEVWSKKGESVTVAHLPVADRVPVAGVPIGPRDFEWRQTEPATLFWSEALDKGDWKVTVPNRDKVMMQKAPFTGSPTEVTRTEQRFSGLDWSEQPHVALLRDYNENKHWTRTWVIDADAPAKPKLIWDRSSDDRYSDPGQPLHRIMPNGAYVIRQDGDAIFLRGNGSSPAGDRPFLDRYSLTTAATNRLFRSDKTSLEYPIAFTDLTEKTFLTWRQSPTDPPNAMLRTLDAAVPAVAGEATLTSTSRAITHIPDPTPEVRSIKRRLVKYKRADGVELSFTLITPPGYKEGTKLPAVLYAYPQDFASAATAGQVTGSDQRFTQLRDYLLLLLSGYAIIDNAAFPIVGDPKKAYDTYLDQLVADAKAAVDEAVKTGVVDRDRIGVTGHSHGALMTANLIAHTDLFKAGVATSGSYNKSLTPFGFQNERRSVWDAQAVYLKVSPFFFADKIKLPLLIVHGQDDANPGTTPLQAVKLFEAIRGNGGTARLVMLPHEPHWYSAMESNEQLAYEELRWFDTYVKHTAPKK